MQKIVLVLAVLLTPVPALAQQPTTTFADVARRGLINAGDNVRIVCDVAGNGRFAEHDVKVIELTETSITIENNEQMFFDRSNVTVPAQRVRSIRRRTSHRGLLGAGIGAAAGFGVGFALGQAHCNNEGGRNCDGRAQAAFGGLLGGPGAAIGAGVGYLFKRGGEEVYVAPASARLAALRGSPLTYSVAPVISQQRRGILFTLTW